MLVVALGSVALTGCVENNVNPVRDWLAGRAGVSEAQIVVDRTSMFGSSGVVRGELSADLDAAGLDKLIAEVAGYTAQHEETEIRLGRDLVDFTVDPDADTTRGWRDTWEQVADVRGLVAADVDADGVLAHVMRPEFAAAWSALSRVDGPLVLEAFRTADDEVLQRGDDDYGSGEVNPGTLRLARQEGCDPSADALARTDVVIADERLVGGIVDLCADVSLRYDDDTDLVAVAQFWSDRQAADADPARSLLVSEGSNDSHVIDVTPGRPDLFAVAQTFEVPGAPDVIYTLPGDGTFTVQGFDVAAADLVAALASVPESAQLATISLTGDAPEREGSSDGGSVSATGSLSELTPLLAEADALLKLDPEFYSVDIFPGTVNVSLYSPPGTDPDMVAAATALRSSPLWQTNDVSVQYLNGYVGITDGIAVIGSDYTDREPYDAFIEAWNASATG